MRAVGVIMLIVALLIAASQQLTTITPSGSPSNYDMLPTVTNCRFDRNCGYARYCRNYRCVDQGSYGAACTANVQCHAKKCNLTAPGKGTCG